MARSTNWDKANRQHKVTSAVPQGIADARANSARKACQPSTRAQREYIVGLRIDLDLDPRNPPVPQDHVAACEEIERLKDLKWPERVERREVRAAAMKEAQGYHPPA